MKKINNKFLLLFSLIIALVFTSCEKQENVMFLSTDGFIQLKSKSSINTGENNTDPIVLDVLFGGNASQNTAGITVDFTVTTDDVSRYTVIPAGGTLEIPAGAVSGQIILTPVDNILADGNAVIKIELSQSSSKAIGLGGEGLSFISQTITIIDDDCAIVLADMVGTYKGKDNWYASAGGPLSTQFTTTFDGTNLLSVGLGYAWLANPSFWGEPIVKESSVPLEIDLVTGVVTIPYTYTATTTYNGNPYDYYVEGSGVYFPCSDTFEIEYLLYFDDAGTDPVAPAFGVPSYVWKETLTR
jgi:hypothetical protein